MRNDFLFGIDWAIGLSPEFIEGWGTYYRTCTFDPEKVREPKFPNLCFVHGSESELKAGKVCVIRDQLTLARESIVSPGHWIEVKPTSKAIPFEGGTLIFISQTMNGNSRVVWRDEKCRKFVPRTYSRKEIKIKEEKMESLDVPFSQKYYGIFGSGPIVLPQGKLWAIGKNDMNFYLITDWVKNSDVTFLHPLREESGTVCVLLSYEESDVEIHISIARLPLHSVTATGEFFKCSRNSDEKMFQKTKVFWIKSKYHQITKEETKKEWNLAGKMGFRFDYDYFDPIPNPYLKKENSTSSGLFYDESHDSYYNNFYE